MQRVTGFRVTEVMTGHSASASILGVDSEGRQIRLEVPTSDAAAVRPGQVLVLSWATLSVPESAVNAAPTDVLSGELVDDLGLFGGPRPAAADADAGAALEAEAEADARATLAEFQALMGLR